MSLASSRRLRQYLLFRLLIIVVGFILATVYVAYLTAENQEATAGYLFSILTVYAVVGVSSMLTWSHWSENRGLQRLQILVDFGLQALLIWSTGGIVSFFIPLLFVTFVAATALGGARAALWLASMTTIFLIGNTTLYSLDVTPPWGGRAGEIDSLTTAYLLMSVLALYGLALLGSRYSTGLRNAENLQAEVVESMAEGLLVVDKDARVLLINEELRSALELEQPAVAYVERPFVEVLKESRAFREERTFYEALSTALMGEERQRFEISAIDHSGATRQFEVKVSMTTDDKGHPSHRIALFSDLTLKKENEEKERRIQKLEDLRELAMGLAHEIRNPLASIRGCVQELDRLAESPERRGRLIEIVLRESDRLDDIIENFQRFAQTSPVRLDPVDVKSLIGEAVLLLENRADFGGRKISWRPPAEPMTVLADPGQMVQVILNLGINAIQATSPEHGRLGFELLSKCRKSGDDAECRPDVTAYVELHVWDNGKGIPSADQKRVFHPFYTTKEAGSGLGLSIVEKMIREHRGTIDVESVEGRGTRFVIRLAAVLDPVREAASSRNSQSIEVCHA
jgi:two-component system sensor histidine kinase PilS (NtrC family)